MTKTGNTRYGNFDIDYSILKDLDGVWKSTDGFYEIAFHGREMDFCGLKTKIHALRSKSQYEPNGRYIIADDNPSVEGWRGFCRLTYQNGVITTQMRFCDAPSVEYVFTKASPQKKTLKRVNKKTKYFLLQINGGKRWSSVLLSSARSG